MDRSAHLEALAQSNDPTEVLAGYVGGLIDQAGQGIDGPWVHELMTDVVTGNNSRPAADQLGRNYLISMGDLSGLGRIVDASLDSRRGWTFEDVPTEGVPEPILTDSSSGISLFDVDEPGDMQAVLRFGNAELTHPLPSANEEAAMTRLYERAGWQNDPTLPGQERRDKVAEAILVATTGSDDLAGMTELVKGMGGYSKTIRAREELDQVAALDPDVRTEVAQYAQDVAAAARAERAAEAAQKQLAAAEQALSEMGMTIDDVTGFQTDIATGEKEFLGVLNFPVADKDAYLASTEERHPGMEVLQGVAITGSGSLSGIHPEFATFYMPKQD